MYSLYLYPWDAAGSQMAGVLGRIAAAGINTVKVAAIYHTGKILLTANSSARVRFPEDGAVYFRPFSEEWHNLALKPPISRLCATGDPLAEICAEAPRHGLAVGAWVVCLHNRAITAARPDVSTVNAYGDRYPHSLCPMQPEVRQYLRGMVQELAGRPLRNIVLEAAGFVPFRHYSYVQVEGVEVGDWENLLLSLCFCEACVRELPGMMKVRALVRAELDEFLRTGLPRNPAQAAGALKPLLSARTNAITDLVRLMSETAARGGKRLSVIASGGPADVLTGIDLAKIGRYSAAVDFAYYDAANAALDGQLAAVCAAIPPSCMTDLLLRPGFPDARSAEDIGDKLSIGRKIGLANFSFYNYGLLPAQAWEWMKQAIAESR